MSKPGDELSPASAPFAIRENEPVKNGPRRVGEAYWPAGISPDPLKPQSIELQAKAVTPVALPIPPAAEVPAQRMPDKPREMGGTTVQGGSWGEAGGFPRVPKRQGEVAPRGPVWLEALKDPVSIVIAVALAGVMGGVGTYLGWKSAAHQEAARFQSDSDNKISVARAEFEARQKVLETDLQGARSKLADVERANAAMEKQGKDTTKALAEAKATVDGLQQKFDALQKTQTQNEEGARIVADLAALRSEQTKLVQSLQDVVADGGEVGTDGPYVFVRLKTRLYADNSNKPADAVVGAVKKVAAFAKTYEGPYRLHVEGHTDANPGPSAAGEGSNLHAGAMRALDIARILVDGGVSPSRVTLLSQGEAFPLRASKTDDSVAMNRRVELVFAPSRTIAPITVGEPAVPVKTAIIPKAVPVIPATATAVSAVPAAVPVAVVVPPAGAVKPVTVVAVPVAAVVAPVVPAVAPGSREPVPAAPAVMKSGTVRERARPASGR